MMSFSRRIGISPSMIRRVRWLPLVTTDSPRIMRSPGFNSTFKPINFSPSQQRASRAKPPQLQVTKSKDTRTLAEQLEYRLVGLIRKRQGGCRKRLPSLQSQQVGA